MEENALQLWGQYKKYLDSNDEKSQNEMMKYVELVVEDEPFSSNDGIEPHNHFNKRVFMKKVEDLFKGGKENPIRESADYYNLVLNEAETLGFEKSKFFMLILFLKDYVNDLFYNPRKQTSLMKLRKLRDAIKGDLKQKRYEKGDHAEDGYIMRSEIRYSSKKKGGVISIKEKRAYEILYEALRKELSRNMIEVQMYDNHKDITRVNSYKQYAVYRLMRRLDEKLGKSISTKDLNNLTAKVIYIVDSSNDEYKNGCEHLNQNLNEITEELYTQKLEEFVRAFYRIQYENYDPDYDPDCNPDCDS